MGEEGVVFFVCGGGGGKDTGHPSGLLTSIFQKKNFSFRVWFSSRTEESLAVRHKPPLLTALVIRLEKRSGLSLDIAEAPTVVTSTPFYARSKMKKKNLRSVSLYCILNPVSIHWRAESRNKLISSSFFIAAPLPHVIVEGSFEQSHLATRRSQTSKSKGSTCLPRVLPHGSNPSP